LNDARANARRRDGSRADAASLFNTIATTVSSSLNVAIIAVITDDDDDDDDARTRCSPTSTKGRHG
jgi:hypothetical protein